MRTHEVIAARFGTPTESPTLIAMSRTELAQMFAECGFRHGAEVGVWKGVNAETLCAANPDLHLLCVDPWAPQPDYLEQTNEARVMRIAYKTAMKRLARYRCTFIRETSVAAAAQVPDGSLDFVYIDANHTYEPVLADIRAWEPKVRSGGIVSGHDFATRLNRHIDVERAVRDYTAANQIAPWFTVYAGRQDGHPSWLWVKA